MTNWNYSQDFIYWHACKLSLVIYLIEDNSGGLYVSSMDCMSTLKEYILLVIERSCNVVKVIDIGTSGACLKA